MKAPLKLRKLKADMVMKDLTLRALARKARVPYTTASLILNGYRIDPQNLSRLVAAIERAPYPVCA